MPVSVSHGGEGWSELSYKPFPGPTVMFHSDQMMMMMTMTMSLSLDSSAARGVVRIQGRCPTGHQTSHEAN